MDVSPPMEIETAAAAAAAASRDDSEDEVQEEGYSSQYEEDDDYDDSYEDLAEEEEFEVALEDTINPLLIQDVNIMREWWGTESIDFKIFEALDEIEVILHTCYIFYQVDPGGRKLAKSSNAPLTLFSRV